MTDSIRNPEDLKVNVHELNIVLGTMMRVYRSFGDRALNHRLRFSEEVLLTRISDLAGLATFMAAKSRFLDDMEDLIPTTEFRDDHHFRAVGKFIHQLKQADNAFDAAPIYEALARY